jgi:membrane protein implicated in regulation of membrane protease activity
MRSPFVYLRALSDWALLLLFPVIIAAACVYYLFAALYYPVKWTVLAIIALVRGIVWLVRWWKARKAQQESPRPSQTTNFAEQAKTEIDEAVL